MRLSGIHRLAILGCLLLALIGCGQGPLVASGGASSGPGTPPTAQGCGARSVEILVGEGFLQELCGCSNIVNGTVFAPGTAFNCTGPVPSVANPTVFFFHYVSRVNRHQIISTSAPGFPTGPIYDPSTTNPIRIFAVQVTATGTYSFRDSLNTTLFGAITL